MTVPLGASAVMLGFGFLIAFDEEPVDFRSSWWLVPVAQSLIAAPFVVRIVTPALRSIDPALREVAATLGASPLRSRREINEPHPVAMCRRASPGDLDGKACLAAPTRAGEDNQAAAFQEL